MPDLDRRSSASFISSNEGGIPDSFSRSLMKRRSSNCLRVSISWFLLSFRLRKRPKTNHERTLYVLCVFRNPLIWREQVEGPLTRPRKPKDHATIPGLRRRRESLANHETIGLCERRHHRGVLYLDRRGDPGSVAPGSEHRTKVIGAFVVFGHVGAQDPRFAGWLDVA